MTIRDVLRRATEHLASKGVESARLDAERLLAHALGLTRIELYTEHDRPLTDAELRSYRQLVGRRARREPLAYVLGEWDFRRVTLKVDARALVPRPETEIVVERCLALLAPREHPRVLDVGVGSGAIAIAIAEEHPTAQVTALEKSPDALALARENLARTGLGDRVTLVDGDLVAGFGEHGFDLVVSNPPYVAADEIEELEPEVRDWEPRVAILDDGLTETVAVNARDALRAGGHLVLEVAAARAREGAGLLERLGYDEVRVTADLAGRERVVEGRWTQ